MSEFRQGTIVKHKGDDSKGVVIDDDFGDCTPDETLVVWEGTDSGDATSPEALESVGIYDPSVANMRMCGQGKAGCCKYLAIGPDGPECLRFGSLRNTVLARSDMRAEGSPNGLYPKCQEEIQAGIAEQERSSPPIS